MTKRVPESITAARLATGDAETILRPQQKDGPEQCQGQAAASSLAERTLDAVEGR
jgi:hypothetical protein